MTPPRLLLLTDRAQLPPGASLLGTIRRCLPAGLQVVVLRELDLPGEHRARLAADLAATGVAVIGARTRLPAATGTHLGSAQPAADAGDSPVWGRSCHGEDEVRRAVAEAADYVTISPVAATASKPGYGPALGEDGVRNAVRAAGATPVYALGGVDAVSAHSMRAAGAYGVAVMGAVMRAADPAAEVRRLLAAVA